MEVEYLIAARYAEVTEGSGLSLIGGLVDQMKVAAYPYHIPSLFIAARVSLTQEEARLTHVLRIRIIGPDNEQILETEEFRPPPREVHTPFDFSTVHIVVGFMNFVIFQGGLVRVHLLYDGEQVKESRLWIEDNVPPGQPELPPQVNPEGEVN